MVPSFVRGTLAQLPRGRTLTQDAWEQRHRWMLWLLVANAAGVFVFALTQGFGLGHSLFEAGIVAVFAALGYVRRTDRMTGSGAVAVGLLTASAVSVHLSGGAIEAHFHFFVMIAVLTLYEDWLPFLVAVGYVLFHHGVLGVIAAESVFAHEAAVEHPWTWALIHAAFVAAAGAANVLAWRLHEDTRRDMRQLADIVQSSDDAILSVGADTTLRSWNAGACRLLGFDRREVVGRPLGAFLVSESPAEDRAVFDAILHGEHVQDHESVWRAKDGRAVDVRVNGSPIRDAHGVVVGASAIVQDLTERKRAAAELRDSREALAHQALHDALTGLPNRTLLQDRLEQALQRTRRQQSHVAVLFLDIDRFKMINDSLGHAAGDELLILMTARLDEVLRPADTLARFGGDELVILCEDVTREEEAVTLADRVVTALSSPVVIGGREVPASASVGVAFSTGADTADELLRDADIAMYRAKERGGARFEVFDSEMRTRSLQRLQIDNELRLALQRDELRLHFQPVVSLDDRGLIGAEALVRWEHPERGLLAPGEFIPVAEESALIVGLGEWVLRNACRQLAAWEPELPDHFMLAVNVSARQFADPSLIGTVRSALSDAGASPGHLALELTESVLMQQEGAEAVLSGLKELGVRVVMDDFGTGYSSLGYLSRFALDGLKVDRSFVARMTAGSAEHAIIAAVGTMADAMNLHLVAEGIESDDQREELARLGYRFGQGFLFARPMDADAFSGVLGRTPAAGPRTPRP